MQQPEAALFSEPVSDADAPEYSSIVSQPMDLGTIKSRLQRKKYSHPADVYADIRQVMLWLSIPSNCSDMHLSVNNGALLLVC